MLKFDICETGWYWVDSSEEEDTRIVLGWVFFHAVENENSSRSDGLRWTDQFIH